ncbi:response regulator transcription factor [Pseudothauera nasutitermitis]|uniref:Response regulator transcription factor n=1 Tax=Pseudothauera nasutitermitis TaxID=2565930 RepID=A0A4S4AWF3_9RHOO|nr:response regulator transcription factor [Pseudothauera nasutitermitis]THF63575.1 response regulator transcription factor [Pseudothauera nasutitermitis]
MSSVLIADDHAIIRDGLKMILADEEEFAVVGEAANGHEVLAKIRERDWDILLLDISMPGRNGLDLIKQIRTEKPLMPILVLTMHQEGQYALRALRAGASGYVTKENDAEQLVTIIRKVMNGGVYLSPAMAEQLARGLIPSVTEGPPHTRLSDREYQIFQMLIVGKGLSDIATELNLSVKTVSTHKTRILAKMNLTSLSELIRYAIAHDLLDRMPEGGT